jgi:uncharacterized protein YraI
MNDTKGETTMRENWLLLNRPIRRGLLLIMLVSALLLAISPALPPVTAQDDDPTVRVQTTANLRLRAAPSTAARIYNVAQRGSTLTAEAISPSYRWVRVTFHGQGGWMSRAYLEVVNGDIATLPVSSEYVPPAVVSPTQYLPRDEVIVAALNDVNIRLEPTVEATEVEDFFDPERTIITVFPAGQQASALAITPDALWVFVQYGSYRGWVKGQYLDVVSGSLDDLRQPPANLTVDGEGIAFAADTTAINPGQCTTLRWFVQGEGSVFYKAQTVFGEGFRVECPAQTTRYTLLVNRPGNVILTRAVTIAVITTQVEFAAEPATIGPGQCSMLNWEISAASQIFLDQEEVPASGTREVCPAETTTYQLRVYTLSGELMDYETTVTVDPTITPEPVIVSISFTADRTVITSGACANLSWVVANAQSVLFEGEGVSGVGTREVCPTTTTTYTLQVTLEDGSMQERTIVIVVN